MAEYIDKTKLLTDINNGIKAGNLEEGYEQYQNINNMDDIIEAIEWSDEEDVVERSEYDKLEKEYNHYKRLAEQDSELRLKIYNAIKEIIKYRDDEINDFCEVEVGAINGALEIFKKYIGEQV